MNIEKIVMCVIALALGMLVANMLTNVCGCKNNVEGMKFDEKVFDASAAYSPDELTPTQKRTIARYECAPIEDGCTINKNWTPNQIAERCDSHDVGMAFTTGKDGGMWDPLCVNFGKDTKPVCDENGPCSSECTCVTGSSCQLTGARPSSDARCKADGDTWPTFQGSNEACAEINTDSTFNLQTDVCVPVV